jgi:hypothetical protein
MHEPQLKLLTTFMESFGNSGLFGPYPLCRWSQELVFTLIIYHTNTKGGRDIFPRSPSATTADGGQICHLPNLVLISKIIHPRFPREMIKPQ